MISKSIDGPFVSIATHLPETSGVLQVHTMGSCDKRPVTFNILPDDVLLHIFYLDRVTYHDGLKFYYGPRLSWRWDRLVHVCRRWRSVVFASPNFLDLRLVFGPTTPMELTCIWPPLPIIIKKENVLRIPEDHELLDAAIVHHNRVCEIDLRLTGSQLQLLASAMQKPFPALLHLDLGCYDCHRTSPPALPDGFLGGSVSRLQSLILHGIPFPALPKLLLSATHLVRLSLGDLSGRISPEALVAALAMLANLKYLDIYIDTLSESQLEWGSRRPPPPTRAVLPALSSFAFLTWGSEYLEDLVARIDAPLLDSVHIRFFYELIFDTTQLAQFMRRATRLQTVKEAHVTFTMSGVQVTSHAPRPFFDEMSGITISCDEVDWEHLYLEKIFTSFSPLIHKAEHLYIHGYRHLLSQWQEDINSMQWLEIFQPFTAVRNLYAIKEFAKCIAPALQDLVGERVTDVLPALESLFLEELQPSGPIQEAIGKFVAARQFSGRPVTVSLWERDHEWDILLH